MSAIPSSRRLPFAAALLLAVSSAGCSVEQTVDRCASQSASLNDLITCARDKHAVAKRCETLGQAPGARPVAGRRILSFGDTTNNGSPSRGIVFGAADRAEVYAPMSGTVTFAATFRSYGELMIIDACTKITLLAGTFEPNVIDGQPIAAGEAVARMRQTSTEPPVLYLELRENGAAIDPAGLIPSP